MADRFYGVNRGGTRKDVTEASSTTSLDFEVRFELISGMRQSEVIDALEYIKQAILEDDFLPA